MFQVGDTITWGERENQWKILSFYKNKRFDMQLIKVVDSTNFKIGDILRGSPIEDLRNAKKVEPIPKRTGHHLTKIFKD